MLSPFWVLSLMIMNWNSIIFNGLSLFIKQLIYVVFMSLVEFILFLKFSLVKQFEFDSLIWPIGHRFKP
jgi:hypothetical protein